MSVMNDQAVDDYVDVTYTPLIEVTQTGSVDVVVADIVDEICPASIGTVWVKSNHFRIFVSVPENDGVQTHLSQR